MSKKKMGRPTTDPKPYSLHIRINENENEILDKYCNRHKKTRAQGVRDGITSLEDK